MDIQANLAIDYIFLDRQERRKFAQSSHEYLIDQVQTLEIVDVKKQQLQTILNNFVHPSKELIWVAQLDKYTKNTDNYTKTQFDNYTIGDDKTGIVEYSNLNFHSLTRVLRLPRNYFNCVQPYEAHSTSPAPGICVYSFGLAPENIQPSGTANFSRLSRVMINLEFDESLYPEDSDPEPIDVRFYTRSVNILRFVNGMCGVAFSYG